MKSKEVLYCHGEVGTVESLLPLDLGTDGFTSLPQHGSGQNVEIKVFSIRPGNRTRSSGWRVDALQLIPTTCGRFSENIPQKGGLFLDRQCHSHNANRYKKSSELTRCPKMIRLS